MYSIQCFLQNLKSVIDFYFPILRESFTSLSDLGWVKCCGKKSGFSWVSIACAMNGNYTKTTEVNLSAFVYRLFHEDFSPLTETLCNFCSRPATHWTLYHLWFQNKFELHEIQLAILTTCRSPTTRKGPRVGRLVNVAILVSIQFCGKKKSCKVFAVCFNSLFMNA